MERSTHVAGGIAAGMLICCYLPLTTLQAISGISISAIMGFLPDQIQTSVPWIQIKLMEGHRGYSHTMAFALIAGVLITAFSWQAALFVFCGLLSHYLLDLPSDAGIPLWYPIIRRRVALGWFNNGSRGEFITAGLLITLSVWMILAY